MMKTNNSFPPTFKKPLSNHLMLICLVVLSLMLFISVGFNIRPLFKQQKTYDGGICLVRDAYTSIPSGSSQAVGKGYAKINKRGSFTYNQIKDSCGDNEYSELLQLYCEENSNPVQFQVAVINKFGGVETSGCSKIGCGFVDCPLRTGGK